MMIYNIDELILKDGSEEEQARTRIIFENLKHKAINGEKLSEHESIFFCRGVNISTIGDGKIEDYTCCSNYKFKSIYLVYFRDLSGNSSYEKINGLTTYLPAKLEVSKDLNYLKCIEIEWYNIVCNTKHKDELLKQITTETRNELKQIENSKGALLFNIDKINYSLSKSATLLQSKFLYCTALEIFEMFEKKEFLLYLNGNEIVINEYSIVHILNRHFAHITKPNSIKSFHNSDFTPRLLNKHLKSIFEDIDKSKLLLDISINKIAFQFNNIDYHIWIHECVKYLKGRGKVKFNRLETFYPVKDSKEINDLKQNFKLEVINENLKVYIDKNFVK
jgi:hypothetical protein